MVSTTFDQMRGMPLWLMREYLEELGGVMQPDGWITGEGWRARLTQLEDYRVRSLSIGQIRVEWEADEAAQARTWPLLEQKLLRAGG
jgi:hypothetical protein